jgi:predicted nucleic acid-binding protein
LAASIRISRSVIDVQGIDFDAAIRWARVDPGSKLHRRGDEALPFIRSGMIIGSGLLLDTCFYIDQMQQRAPASGCPLVSRERANHSTVAVQELMHGVGVLDPRHRGTPAAILQIRAVIRAMSAHRLYAPDADVLARAALLCGILSRLQGYARDQRLRLLQDCVLFLQAQKLGLAVLTRNIGDFDLLLQLFPMARVLFYRV